ncbi:DUF4956 domain-containing protein [Dactylosporangium sp. NPDC049742]|uniref:DUF4956 domain-containing protein n=1 Tax=Dactylosporangium sp. NPDC049742 TaxID=3154737 RepID=UPI0034354CDE
MPFDVQDLSGTFSVGDIAAALSLSFVLSAIIFRNAIKETRDVGFIFLVMGVGMAAGTRFYTLAIVATVAICLIITVMYRFNWFALNVQRQVVKVQVPPDGDYAERVRDVLIRLTSEFELVSMESIRGGALTELMYTVRLAKGKEPTDLVAALSERTAGQRVTVLTGYDQTDL